MVTWIFLSGWSLPEFSSSCSPSSTQSMINSVNQKQSTRVKIFYALNQNYRPMYRNDSYDSPNCGMLRYLIILGQLSKLHPALRSFYKRNRIFLSHHSGCFVGNIFGWYEYFTTLIIFFVVFHKNFFCLEGKGISNTIVVLYLMFGLVWALVGFLWIFGTQNQVKK